MAIVTLEKNNYTVEKLHQWDLNRTLEIRGLSLDQVPEIHFTNDLMVAAVRRFATVDGKGVIRVEVPNALLQQPHTIKAMVCIREGDVFKTTHTIRIPVVPRQKPADYTITDDQDIYSYNALEELVHDSVTRMEAENSEAWDMANRAIDTSSNALTVAREARDTANGIEAIATEAKEIAEGAEEAARAAASAGSQENLLDNSYFAAPRNTNGLNLYSGTARITIDRWKTTSKLDVEVLDTSVRLTCVAASAMNGFSQMLYFGDLIVGDVFTFAMMEANGTLHVGSAEYSDENVLQKDVFKTSGGVIGRVFFNGGLKVGILVPAGGSIDIKWVALYRGAYTANTLPEYRYNSVLEAFRCGVYDPGTDTYRGYSHVLDAYPVGSFYISSDGKSPASLFGGTWEYRPNVFLYGAGAPMKLDRSGDGSSGSDGDGYNQDVLGGIYLGDTGGASRVTLTTEQIPAHTHDIAIAGYYNTGDAWTSQVAIGRPDGNIYNSDNAVSSAGGGASHENMPPYLAVAIWERIA